MCLIQDSLSGNQQAQKILYDKYKKVVKDYLRGKYSNYQDIDDDVSEIIIKIFMNLAVFDPEKSKFKTWVISIANNYMIDKWRSNQSQYFVTGTITLCDDPSYQFTVGDPYPQYGYSVTAGIDGQVFTASNGTSVFSINNGTFTSCNGIEFENCSSINYISQQISAQDFALLDMKYVQGYEYCEIGKEFNTSSNTVSNRVNYLKTKLKKNHFQEIHD